MELPQTTQAILTEMKIAQSDWNNLGEILARPDFLYTACGKHNEKTEENLLARRRIVSTTPGATPTLVNIAFEVRHRLQKFEPPFNQTRSVFEKDP